MEVAALGIKVDATGAESAGRALDNLVSKSDAAEKALSRVENTASKTGSTLKTVGEGASKNLDAVTTAADGAAKSQTEAGKSSQNMAQSLRNAGAAGKDGAAGVSTMATASDSLASSANLAAAGIKAFISLRVIDWAKESSTALFQASAAAERLRISLDFSSTRGSAAEIAYLKKTTDDLGLSFASTATAYQQFSAAARGTALEGDKARAVFEAVSKASAVMGLTASNTSGVLLALQQMISKGTVQSEELRGQLGERLPGAFQIAARAMGVTTAELGKMLEQGQVVADTFLPKFAQELERSLGDASERAANRLDASVNRFNNAWDRLKQAAGDSGVSQAIAKELDAVGRDVTAITEAIDNSSRSGGNALQALGSGAAVAAGRAGFATLNFAANTLNGTINLLTGDVFGLRTDLALLPNVFRTNAEQVKTLGTDMEAAQAKLKRLQELDAMPSNGNYYKTAIAETIAYISKLQEAINLKNGLGSGLANAYTEGVGNNRATIKQREDEAAAEKELADVRMRLAGITNQYFKDLATAQKNRDLGLLSEKAYVEVVSDIAKKTYDASTAGKEAAKQSRENASASKKEQTAYASLSASIAEKISINKSELEYSGRLNDAQKAEIKLNEDLKTGKLKLTASDEARIRTSIAVWKEQEKAKEQVKRNVELYKEQVEIDKEIIAVEARRAAAIDAMQETLRGYNQSVSDSVALTKLEYETLGMNSVARSTLIEQMRIEFEWRDRIEKIKKSDAFASNAERDAAIAEAEALRDKAKANAQTKAYVSEWEKAYDQSSQALTDALMKGGKNAGEYLTDYFRTLVFTPIVKAIVQPVAGSIASTVTSSLGFGGGSSDASSVASNVGLLSNLTGAVGAGVKAGLSGWAGTLGLSGTGTTISGSLSAGFTALGAGNIAGGLGTLLGVAGPVLGGISLISSLMGGFGSRGANHMGAAYSTSVTGNNAAAAQLFGTSSGDWYGDLTSRYSAEVGTQLGKSVEALSGVYKSLAKYAGDSAKQIDIVAGFAANSKYADESAYGYFKLIDKISGTVLKDYTARDNVLSTDPAKAYEQFIAEMGGSLIDQIKSADIPGWMKSIFDTLGTEVTVDGLNQALQAITAVDKAFTGWADTLHGFANLSAEAQTALLNTSGGLDTLSSNISTFYSGFYTEQERMATLQRQVLEQLSSLDVSIDTSTAEKAKESFRKTVEDALGSGNAELAAKLLSMSGAFATAADYAAKSAEEAAKISADSINESAQAIQDAAEAMAAFRKEAQSIVQSQQQSLQSLIDSMTRQEQQTTGGYIGSLWLSGAEFTQFSGFADQLDGATKALAQLQALGLGDELAGYSDQIGEIVQQTKQALAASLASQRLMAGDASGAVAAAVSANMPQYAEFTNSGIFNAGAFNAATTTQRAKAASGLIGSASANALSIPGISGVLGSLVGEIAAYSRDVVLRDLRIQGAESLGPAVSGMLTSVYERLAESSQAMMVSGPGLAGVMSARMQYNGVSSDIRVFNQAIESLRGALESGKISASDADKAIEYLNNAFGELSPLVSDAATQAARMASSTIELRNAGLSSIEYYFGSLSEIVGKMDAAAASANTPLSQTVNAIGLLDSAATAFGQSAAAALEGAQNAISGYMSAASLAMQGGEWNAAYGYSSAAAGAQASLNAMLVANSSVSRAQLISDSASFTSSILTTASAAKAAQELAGKLVLGEGQSMRDLSLLVQGVGQYDNAGFYDAFIRISDALGSGLINTDQYKTLFDYAVGTYQGVSDEAKATAAAFDKLRDSMKSFADALLIGDKTTLSPAATLTEMRRQYVEAFNMAASGDVEAISKYQSLANTLLDKSLYSTQAEYNAIFGQIYGDARALERIGVNMANNPNAKVEQYLDDVIKKMDNSEAILAAIAKATADTSRGVDTLLVRQTP